MRLRNDGVAVYGFGEEKTPEPFVKACSVFLYLEKLGEPEGEARDAAATTKARTQHELQGEAALARILRNAEDAAKGADGWSHLSGVGSHIRNQGEFNSTNYGYRKQRIRTSAVTGRSGEGRAN